MRRSNWAALCVLMACYLVGQIIVAPHMARAHATSDKPLDSFNRAHAVAYADQWSTNGASFRNPTYPQPSNGDDCTNFISQSLYEAGMPTIDAGSLNNPWHPDNTLLPWINVNAFENSFELAGRLTIETTTMSAARTVAEPGDVFMYDWGQGEGYSHLALMVGNGPFADYVDPTDGRNYRDFDGGAGDYIDQHVTDRSHSPWNYGYLTEPDPQVRAKMSIVILHFNTTEPPITPPAAPKVLVIGDSITQGMIGDYTWRYRLLQNFQATNTAFQFVGHRPGTYDMYADPSYSDSINGVAPPDPNHIVPEPTDGSYRVNAPLAHDAQWGWTLGSAMSQVGLDAAAYTPDYLVVALGYNDMAFGTSATQAQADVLSIVSTVRQYVPNVRVLVTTIIQRSPLAGYPNVNVNSSAYNASVRSFVANSIATAASPAAVADVAGGYNAATDSWDGLHPNSIGEFKIARAVAVGLQTLGLGSGWALSIPTTVDSIPLATPQLWLENTPAGIKVHWSHIYGASGYVLSSGSASNAMTSLPLPLGGDWWLDRNVHSGSVYYYSVQAVRGAVSGSESKIFSITAAVSTLDGPQPGNVAPSASGLSMNWPAVTGATGYVVNVYDSAAGAVTAYKTSSGSFSLAQSGMVAGHPYALTVQTVNTAGIGPAEPQAGFISGRGVPARSTLNMSVVNADNDLMQWTVDASTYETRLYQRSSTSSPWVTGVGRVMFPLPSTYTSWTMPVSASDHNKTLFCVGLENGTLRAPCSNQVFAP